MTKKTGDEESLILSRLKEFENKLDDIIVKLGAPFIEIDADIERLLNLSYEELRKVHPDDCSNGAYKLKQYAIFLQQKENRFRNIKNWAKSKLDYVVGKEASGYGDKWTKYEEKRAAVINDNTFAYKLNELYQEYEAYEGEVFMISNRVTELARTLSEIRQNKRDKT